MRILLPLGFLGLIGIAVLILIYLLKPNYQQKVISSTHIWKLSLRYRKKRIPISKLRSLLILLCQILVVTACAFILAKPVTPSETVVSAENVAIIDASAAMRAESDGETRFARAVQKAKELAVTTFGQENGKFSVIFAGGEPYYIAQRATIADKDDLFDRLDELITANDGDSACTYVSADVESALILAQKTVDENPLAQVYLYTGTRYSNEGDVNVVSVAEEGEWNAAVLEASASKEDNSFVFEAEIASYGRDEMFTVRCDIYGANADKKTINLTRTISCTGEKTQKVTFTMDDNDSVPVYAFDSAKISIEADDNYAGDNYYDLYGGRREKMRIQYSTSSTNIFWLSALEALQNSMGDRWDFDDPKEVRLDSVAGDNEAALTGFDFYIFEGKMPELLPEYGVIFLMNPDSAPSGANFTVGNSVTGKFMLSAGAKHPITDGIDASAIPLAQYTKITSYDAYQPLWYCGDDPVLMVKEDFREQDGVYRTIIVLPFSFNNTYFSLDYFPELFLNVFNHCLPVTVTDADGEISNSFEVGESAVLTARGVEAKVKNTAIGYEKTLAEFEGSFSRPGTYVVSQTVLFETPVFTEDRIFVKIAAKESNINRLEESLADALIRKTPPDDSKDWLLYLAIALTAFLFVEWLLQAKENF